MQCVACVWYRPDGIGTVLHEEWDSFLEVKDRLRRLVENQLTNFRSAGCRLPSSVFREFCGRCRFQPCDCVIIRFVE